MTQSRFCAVSPVLRAALLAMFFVAAMPALSFDSAFFARAGTVGKDAFTTAALVPFDPAAENDDLGLDIGPVFSGSEALFTIVYNASSYGEMYPCPT